MTFFPRLVAPSPKYAPLWKTVDLLQCSFWTSFSEDSVFLALITWSPLALFFFGQRVSRTFFASSAQFWHVPAAISAFLWHTALSRKLLCKFWSEKIFGGACLSVSRAIEIKHPCPLGEANRGRSQARSWLPRSGPSQLIHWWAQHCRARARAGQRYCTVPLQSSAGGGGQCMIPICLFPFMGCGGSMRG